MALVEMKSVFDRQVKGVEGANVGVTNPSDGNFYTNEGSTDSPFDSDDHMVDLLTKDVLSENSGVTHQKSPNQSDFQDLDAVDGGNGYFHGVANPGKYQGKQLGNPGKDLHEAMLTQAYTNNGITVGPSPGPSGHSEFQDLDKILPSGNESLGQFGGPYAYGVGPSDGYY